MRKRIVFSVVERKNNYYSLSFTGLGPTVSELNVDKFPIFPKTRFSMLVPEVEKHLKTMPRKHVID